MVPKATHSHTHIENEKRSEKRRCTLKICETKSDTLALPFCWPRNENSFAQDISKSAFCGPLGARFIIQIRPFGRLVSSITTGRLDRNCNPFEYYWNLPLHLNGAMRRHASHSYETISKSIDLTFILSPVSDSNHFDLLVLSYRQRLAPFWSRLIQFCRIFPRCRNRVYSYLAWKRKSSEAT